MCLACSPKQPPRNAPPGARPDMANPPATISTLNAYPSTRFNLSIGAPSYGPPDELCHSLADILQSPDAARHLFSYNDEHGLPELISLWTHIILSPPNTPLPTELPSASPNPLMPHHNLMITPGANQAIMNILLATCSPGDEVLLPLPYYFSHHTAIMAASLVPVLIAPDPDTLQPDLAALRAAISPRTRALIVATPSNPSGIVLPSELLEQLSSMCRSNSIWLITDEVYRDLAFAHKGRIAPAVKLAPHTARVFSLSKSHGIPGLRVGALIYPSALQNVMVAVQDTMATHTPTLSQIGAVAALKADPWPGLGYRGDLVLRTRQKLSEKLVSMYDELSTTLGSMFHPDKGGGFYLFLPYWDEEMYGRKATSADDGVAVETLVRCSDVLTVPGSAAGLCGFLRVSCASVADEDLDEAADALADGMRMLLERSN